MTRMYNLAKALDSDTTNTAALDRKDPNYDSSEEVCIALTLTSNLIQSK